MRKRRRPSDDSSEWMEPAPKQEKEEADDLEEHSSDDDFSPGQLVIDTADSDVSPSGSKNSEQLTLVNTHITHPFFLKVLPPRCHLLVR